MKKHNWRLMLRRVLNLVFSRLVVTAVLLCAAGRCGLFALVLPAGGLCPVVQRRRPDTEHHHVSGADPAGLHRAGVQDQAG